MLTVNLRGGLGNQLFQLAALSHLSKKTHREPIIIQSGNSPHSSENYFKTIFRNWSIRSLSLRTIQTWYEKSPKYQDTWPTDPFNPRIACLQGYFQDWRYVDPSFVVQLSFPDRTASYPGIRKGIFLHIRGGDYIGNPVHEVNLDSYYERALEYFPDAHFYLFTNDETYAKSKPFIQKLNYTLVNESEVASLFLMSQCAGGICANSTFSWWGAYLTVNRKIIMPDKWFNDSNIPTEYFYPGVIKCPVTPL
jgi:hypothetical protein